MDLAMPTLTQRTDAAMRDVLAGRSRPFAALLFAGPAVVASIAYMDPGNFATNIQAGARYGYVLLWVVVAANLVAMLFQALSANEFIARHIGPRQEDEQHMLASLGFDSLEALSASVIPESIKGTSVLGLEDGLSEAQALAKIKAIAGKNQLFKTYIGQGYYNCHTPSRNCWKTWPFANSSAAMPWCFKTSRNCWPFRCAMGVICWMSSVVDSMPIHLE